MNRALLRLLSISAALVAFAFAAVAQTPKRPMPPTNVVVTVLPDTVQVVDRAYAREGVSLAVRSRVQDRLQRLNDSDLKALANNVDPAAFGLARPAEVPEDVWPRLVAGYADALVADHKDAREHRWAVGVMIVSSILTALAAVPAGMYIERRREKKDRGATSVAARSLPAGAPAISGPPRATRPSHKPRKKRGKGRR